VVPPLGGVVELPVSEPGLALLLSGGVVPPVPPAPAVPVSPPDGVLPAVLLSLPAAPGEVDPVAGSELAGGVVPALPAAVSDCGAEVAPVVSPAPVSDSWPQAARVSDARSATSSAEYFFMCISSQKSLL
jgi:hypothetical protein